MTKRSAHWHDELVKEVLNDPEGRAAYEAFKLQLEVAERLKTARQKAHLTQENVAAKMGTHKPVVARLESGGGKGRHSPSLLTLAKYAHAIGARLDIKLRPETHHR